MSSVAVLLFACALVNLGAVSAVSGPRKEVLDGRRVERTAITLVVRGCSHCRLQPVQNKNADLTWSGPLRRVRNGVVAFDVPTRRTDHMAFLVYAPFDEFAQGGIPMVIVLGFKDRAAGARITSRYAAKTHRVSGCWRGTTANEVRRTLIVNKRRVNGSLIGEDRITVAAGYFTRTLPARPFWKRRPHAEMHASDPSICR